MAIEISKLKTVMGGDPPTKVATVPDNVKTEWNGFMDYMKQKGYAGSKDLDMRNKNMGKQYLDEYKRQNPNISLAYEHIPAIQQWMNNYRNGAWNRVQQGKASTEAKTFDDFMPNLSTNDGWLGSKTSQTYFPSDIQNGKRIGFASVN